MRNGAGKATLVRILATLLRPDAGTVTSAVEVTTDMSSGIVDRFRPMPIRSSSVLARHIAASVARNLTATALAIGGRPRGRLAPLRRPGAGLSGG